jgi:hypothetical protein
LKEPSGPIFGPHLYEFAAELEVLDWNPVVTLLASMESLAEINYYLPGSFAETLARVIREHHHNCRLNLWADQLLSLDGASWVP